eukprot:scaffold10501_cov66-Phaeocystis_antarctica.AAC.3
MCEAAGRQTAARRVATRTLVACTTGAGKDPRDCWALGARGLADCRLLGYPRGNTDAQGVLGLWEAPWDPKGWPHPSRCPARGPAAMEGGPWRGSMSCLSVGEGGEENMKYDCRDRRPVVTRGLIMYV